jgi:hypothetical protein
MSRYKVTMTAELVIELDATSPEEATKALTTHFHRGNAYDPLQGSGFFFKAGWKNASRPKLMTTVWDDATSIEVELVA